MHTIATARSTNPVSSGAGRTARQRRGGASRGTSSAHRRDVPVGGQVPERLLEADRGRDVGEGVPAQGNERVPVADVVEVQRVAEDRLRVVTRGGACGCDPCGGWLRGTVIPPCRPFPRAPGRGPPGSRSSRSPAAAGAPTATTRSAARGRPRPCDRSFGEQARVVLALDGNDRPLVRAGGGRLEAELVRASPPRAPDRCAARRSSRSGCAARRSRRARRRRAGARSPVRSSSTVPAAGAGRPGRSA